jgi:hypothetical protein
MAIDTATETLRSFSEAARRLPPLRKGRPVHPATLWRWATRGVRTRDGISVRLETLKLGGTCCTSDEALARFFRALSADRLQSPETADRLNLPREIAHDSEGGHRNPDGGITEGVTENSNMTAATV